MIVAAHQPNFMPWLGFFDKMRRADVFVIVDHVQFERRNFQNRARIKTPAGPMWITVPVIQKSRDEKILEKEIDNSKEGVHRWGRKIFLTLKSAYLSAPHAADYMPALSDVFNADWKMLVDLNIKLIELTREHLGIKTPMVRSSTMNIPGMKSEMVLNMVKMLGGDTYLSGSGGCKDYLDREAFEKAGVKIHWQDDFKHPAYKQMPSGDGFVEKLSAVDLILNCGTESPAILRGGAVTAQVSQPPADAPKPGLAQPPAGLGGSGLGTFASPS